MEQARITSHQGNQGTQAARGKSQAQGKDSLADTQGGATAGGFMALLAALGDGGAQDALLPQAAAEDALELDPVAADMAAQAVLQGGLLPWQWASAMGGGAVQGGAGPGAGALQTAGPAASPVPLTGGLSALHPLGEGSLLLQTALQDAALTGDERGLAAEIQGAMPAVEVAGKRKMIGRLSPGTAQSVDVASTQGLQGLGSAGVKGSSVTAIQGASPQSSAADRRDIGGAGRDGSRPTEQVIEGVPIALAQFSSDTAVGGRIFARGVDSGASVSGAGGTAELIQDRSMGFGSEAVAEGVDPAMVGAEDAVAEQVAYWVHQNIQNARMTVRHDGQPVEVSVSLEGNEAHVAFGSDEAQTRELLDGSVGQLRDMLRQEGLVLSGVSVGGSGHRSGDENAGSGNPKNAPKQAQVSVSSVGTTATVRANLQGDRAVDIFV